MKVIVDPLVLRAPPTAPEGPVRVKEVLVTLAGATASLKPTVTAVPAETAVAPGPGVLDVIVGAWVSGGSGPLLRTTSTQ